MNAHGSLLEEHLALGATFNESGYVTCYGIAPTSDPEVILCDLTHMDTQLISGPTAVSFATAAFAGRQLAIGECAFEATLTGDARLVSVPLVGRTGEAEYVVFDPTPRAEVLSGWLSFLADVEQDGYRPYEGLAIEEVTARHAVLLLEGRGAARVLADYLGDQPLPTPGTVRALALDALEAIVVCLPKAATPCYLLLVAPRHARVMWRSLLSFPQVVPVGTEGLSKTLTRRLPWFLALDTTDVVRLDAETLMRHGLVREGASYVGARALRG